MGLSIAISSVHVSRRESLVMIKSLVWKKLHLSSPSEIDKRSFSRTDQGHTVLLSQRLRRKSIALGHRLMRIIRSNNLIALKINLGVTIRRLFRKDEYADILCILVIHPADVEDFLFVCNLSLKKLV
jgi:hypothetical protein